MQSNSAIDEDYLTIIQMRCDYDYSRLITAALTPAICPVQYIVQGMNKTAVRTTISLRIEDL